MLIVSELYYPEDKSTGYFVAGIAESLASAGWPVRVLCAQPAAAASKKALPETESRTGVQIKRIAAPGADKNRLGQRGWRIACLTARFALAILREVRRGEPVLVVTNPPTLPWIVSAVAARRRSPSVLLVHDVYPDALVATGLVRRDGFLCRLLNIVQRHTCSRFFRVIVLGRDMKARLAKKFPEIASRIAIISNWADAEEVQCRPRSGNPLRERLGLSQNFVIQFSGNLGRTHGIDDLLSLARELREETRVKFLLFGSGAGRSLVEQSISGGMTPNIVLLPPCARADLGVYLNACDIFFLPFRAGMEGISVPSRLYNVLAAGNPVLAVAQESSELACVVREEECGWVVSPGDISRMVGIVRDVMRDPGQLEPMRLRARRAAVEKYSRSRVQGDFVKLFESLSTEPRFKSCAE